MMKLAKSVVRSHLVMVVALLTLLWGCTHDAGRSQQPQTDTVPTTIEQTEPADVIAVEPAIKPAADSVPAPVRILQRAYPDMAINYKDNILTVNGEQMTYDDKREKSFVEQLDDCDVEDMFAMRYDTTALKPAYLSDAGRGRCEAFFKAMYGHDAGEVARHLVTVDWFGQKLQFSSVNGANRRLEEVASELEAMPELRKFFAQSSTFYWRKVRGANRQSAHSYGMTIDINVANSDYWQWANLGKGETAEIAYKNRIPLEIVRVFEKHGFIWGGRWYHFDTMHFEYRPELLM